MNLNSYRLLPVSLGYFNNIATDFPVSIGDPPPIAITACASKSRAILVASSTVSVVGLGVTLS